MRALSIVSGILLCATAVAAGDRELSLSDLKQVKRICVGLLDTQYGSKPWERLKPYFRDKNAVDPSGTVVCSASCGGEIALRGGYSITCLYCNPMKVGSGKPWTSKDAQVWSISLMKGDRVIFHRETEPKPNPEPPW